MEREVGGGFGTVGTHVHLWLIHVIEWQKPLQYCKVISLQLIKIIGRGGAWKAGQTSHSPGVTFLHGQKRNVP